MHPLASILSTALWALVSVSYIAGTILSGDLIYKGVNDRMAIKRLIRNTLLNGPVCLSTSTTIINEIASNIVSISLIPGRNSL